MATTYRQLMNNILVALTEDEIPSTQSQLTEKYERLIGLYVNHVKELAEDSHNWRALRQQVSTTISAGTNSATITEANERSRVLRVYDDYRGYEVPLVFDVTDSNNPYRLNEMDLAELLRRRTLDTSNGNDPVYFAIDNSSGDSMEVHVWPTPTDERTIQSVMIIPQAALSPETDLDTTIKIPSRPIEVGAIWYALEERGEELGTNGMFSQGLFDRILGEAIMRDAAEQGGYQLTPG